ALQTHLVEGTEVPLTVLEVRKLYEVQKYVALTNFVWTGYTAIANPAAWQKLPKGARDVAERNINQAALSCRNDILHLDATLETQLRSQGRTLTRPDIASFKTAITEAKLYSQWRSHYGAEAWAALEKAVGPLR